MAVDISSEMIGQILELASASPDTEICGLLLGRRGVNGDRVEGILPAGNVAADPARQFELDPVILLAAHRQTRAGGYAVLGHYHSHPSGVSEPSACDAQMAHEDGALWLIVAPPDYAMWRAGAGGVHGRFRRENISALPDQEQDALA